MAADNGQMSFRRGVMSLVILGLLVSVKSTPAKKLPDTN